MIKKISNTSEHQHEKDDNRITFFDDYLDCNQYVSQFLNV